MGYVTGIILCPFPWDTVSPFNLYIKDFFHVYEVLLNSTLIIFFLTMPLWIGKWMKNITRDFD